MYRLPAALWILLAGSTAVFGDGPSFPYKAFAIADQTDVRCGPGETFYPVLHLRAADAVEVWRHDPGGWCAIRPPEGSFSWVSAEFVERRDNRTGIIRGNQVNVRVGTLFSELRDAIQLQLGEGEEVEILEARTLVIGDRPTLWYKISPPAGEFRWVHERHLSRRPLPADVASSRDSLPPSSATNEIQSASFTADPTVASTDKQASEAATARLDALPADASIETALGEMELVLSRMIVAEPTAWEFGELNQRAELLHARCNTAIERNQVRLFLGKISRLEDIRRRYGSIAQLREQTGAVDRDLVDQADYSETVAAPQASFQPRPVRQAAAATTYAQPNLNTARYDGVGRLTQVAAGGATSYALTDDRGDVIAYIAAAPGVNLRQFLNLDVGVNGIRTAAFDGRVQLTAKRVDVLPDGARR